jgi:hypothetical protein
MQDRPTRAGTWRTRLVLVAVLAFAAPPLAAAAVDGRAAAGAEPPIRDPVTLDLAGQRVGPNTCRWELGLALAPGQAALREDVTLVDDATCTLRVQRGVPTEEGEAEDARNMSFRSGQARADTGRAPAGAARALATHSKGYHKSYYEDPVKLDVNSVRNDVDWYWNGSSVSSGLCSYSYGWLSGSGWSLKENNFFCRYEDSQRLLRSSSYAHFRNGVFCFTIDTHTYYDRNNAYGRRDGYLLGTVSASKSGGCTALLSFGHVLKRTLN